MILTVTLLSTHCARSNYPGDAADIALQTTLQAMLLSNPRETFQVQLIPGFTLDGDASDWQNSGLTLDQYQLAADPSGDSTGVAGTDLIAVYMGHDGANLVFYVITDATVPANHSTQIGFWAGYLVNPFADGGGIPTVNAASYDGSPTPVHECLNSTTDIVAGATPVGFEFRISPSACWGLGTNGSIPGTDFDPAFNSPAVQSTQDFNTFFDFMPVERNISWSF